MRLAPAAHPRLRRGTSLSLHSVQRAGLRAVRVARLLRRLGAVRRCAQCLRRASRPGVRQRPGAARRVPSGGGAGNRTPVPKHFREGIYVCSPSIPDVHPLRGYAAFVGPVSDRRDSGTTIGQIFLAGTAAEADRVVSPTLKFPRSRFASEPAPLGLSCRDGPRVLRREGELRFSS